MNKLFIEKKYVIEDNIDFYSALNDSDDEEDDTKVCLISQKILDQNAITLNCGHSFNYVEIYNEVKKQKLSKGITLDSNLRNLKKNEFICPYCRTLQTSLLPHVKNKELNIQYISGVNTPLTSSMPFNSCTYITKSGKNKGVPCKEHALTFNNTCLCSKHLIYYNKKQNSSTLSLSIPHDTCSAILKSGKRKGQPCGAKIYDNINQTCKRHSHTT